MQAIHKYDVFPRHSPYRHTHQPDGSLTDAMLACIDPAIAGIVNRINQLPFIETTWGSCSGHTAEGGFVTFSYLTGTSYETTQRFERRLRQRTPASDERFTAYCDGWDGKPLAEPLWGTKPVVGRTSVHYDAWRGLGKLYVSETLFAMNELRGKPESHLELLEALWNKVSEAVARYEEPSRHEPVERALLLRRAPYACGH